MTDNQTIHKVMGLCWHEGATVLCILTGDCVKCGEPLYRKRDQNPDYTTPVSYCRLMDWMRENNYVSKVEKWSGYSLADLSRQEQVQLIAQAIKEGVLK